jgi:hypothetical protein
MHILIILVLLCLIFPAFARLLGGCLSVAFWLIVIIVVLGLFQTLSR